MEYLHVFVLFFLIGFYILVKIGIINIKTVRKIIDYLLDSNNEETDEYYNTKEEYNESNYYVYDGSNFSFLQQEIITILNKNYSYYNNLSLPLQQVFFDRLYKFMYQKKFIIHSQEPFKEMPVLISAAAVQISFGLKDFELEHYEYIQIHKEEYFAENSFHVLAGNVQGNCITLAWNHFLKGNKNTQDGNNVGLHEMAHALYFQEVVIDESISTFDNHFTDLMIVGENFLQKNKCPHNLYTEYAFTNVQEFWAVSVELFFEKGNELSLYYPKIFDTLKSLLNQNPLNKTNPVLH